MKSNWTICFSNSTTWSNWPCHSTRKYGQICGENSGDGDERLCETRPQWGKSEKISSMTCWRLPYRLFLRLWGYIPIVIITIIISIKVLWFRVLEIWETYILLNHEIIPMLVSVRKSPEKCFQQSSDCFQIVIWEYIQSYPPVIRHGVLEHGQ